MKTSVAKKLRNRVLAAFMAIAVMLSYALPTAITASAAVDPSRFYNSKYGEAKQIEGSEYGVKFDEESAQIRVNGAELKDGETVDSGTDFELYLRWEFTDSVKEAKMVDGGFPVAIHCKIPSDKIKNLGIDWHKEPAEDKKSGVTYEYYVDGEDVYIIIWDRGSKDKDFAGDMRMSAKLQADAASEGTGENVEVQFFDKHVEVKVEKPQPSIKVQKSAGDITYDDKTGKFYVPFTVTVTAPEGGADDVKLTDTFQHDITWGFYDGSELYDFESDDGTFTPKYTEIDKQNASYEIEIGDMEPNEEITFTYSLAIDPTKMPSNNMVTAEAANDLKPGEFNQTPSYTPPTVGKGGRVEENGTTVKWTITFKPEGLEDIDAEEVEEFTITDTPGKGLTFTKEQKEALVKLGATFNEDGSITIPSSAFTKVEATAWSNAYYELEYETETTFSDPLFDTNVSNDVTVTYPDDSKLKDVELQGKGSVTIKGVDDSGISKELVLENGGRLSWLATVELPNFEELKTVVFTDTTTMGSGYQHHKVDWKSVYISYTYKDSDGTEKTVKTPLSEAGNIAETTEYSPKNVFTFSLKDTFIKDLNEHGVRDLVIEYDTVATDDKFEKEAAEADGTCILENTIKFTVTGDSDTTERSKEDKFTKEPAYHGKKQANGPTSAALDEMKHIAGYDEGRYALRWLVQLDNSKDPSFIPKENDVITIVDTLPKGYDITPNSWVLCVGKGEYSYDWWGGADNVEVVKKEEISDGQIQATINITVDKEIVDAINSQLNDWSKTWYISLYYETGMTEDAVRELNGKQPNEEFTNNADILYNNKRVVGGLSASAWGNFGGERKLDKYTLLEDLSRALADNDDPQKRERPALMSDGNGDYILYKLDINKDGIYLGDTNEDGTPKMKELTAVDTLGSHLTFGEVVSGIDKSKIKIENEGHKVTFTLDNGVPYHIVYKAYIDTIPPSQAIGDNEANELFNNKVELKGAEEVFTSKRSTISSYVYHADASISGSSSTTYLEIKGTKLWKNDDPTKRPASIEIQVVQKNLKTNETKTTTYTVDSENASKSGNFEYTTDGDNWTFTLKKLVAKDTSGTQYSYDVTEVKVDGYTVTYDKDGKNIGITGDTSITITNTYKPTQQPEEPKPETVDITINKEWVGGTERPDVTVTLSDGNGYSKEYTLSEKNKWTVTVKGLPKFDKDGNEITYTVTEAEVDGYTSEVTNTDYTFTVTNTYKSTPQKPEEPKPETVDITINKEWVGGTERPDVTVTLSDGNGYSKEYTLGEKNEWTVTVTGLPKFDKDGNKITYTVTEAEVDGYTSEVTNVDYTFTVTNTYKPTPQQPEEPKPTKVEISKKDITNGKELPGAKLKVVDKNGKVIKEWVSTDKPTYFENVFEAGKTYTLIEETAPDGYTVAEKVEFTVKADGTLTTVEMFDSKKPQQPEEPKPTKVEISKKDITNGKELPGAKLKVVDKDGNVIKEWVSTDKPTYFENVFKAGETYTLIEETAPDGYTVAEEVKFTVKADGTLTTVEMFDSKKPQQPEEPKPTKVEISKKDITNGKELPGAKLKVVDENGKVIKEWVSTDKPTYFENVFEAGKTYTLIEETAPDGYTVAEEVKFMVKADGTLTTVEMFDSKKQQETEEPKPTKVEISKKDITNGKELPGAKLKVVDKDGNVIKEWTSTDKPTYFENVFEAGETYTLIEETAPDGYTVAEKVEFTVKENGELTVVEMFDAVKTGTDTDNDSNDKDSGVAQGGGSNDKVTDNDDSPKTGSSCNITLVMLALALGVMAVTNKKRRNH